MTVIERRAYQAKYYREQRATRKAKGLCVTCGRRRARAGVASNGTPFTQCRWCVKKATPRWAANQRRRLRRGLCRSCPRKRQPGDRHVECRRCLSRGRNRAALRRSSSRRFAA